MIFLNGKEIKQEQFGDGTLKCQAPEILRKQSTILWAYDNDGELFTLQCLVDYIRNCEDSIRMREEYPLASRPSVKLILPYVPNARQDRFVSNRIFTLKTFCNIINSLNFDSVTVVDPHSDVTTALLDRVIVQYPEFDLTDYDAVMFPDNGAAKKYAEAKHCPTDLPIIIGNKHRDENGRIKDYELINFPEVVPKRVAIRDDICSYGGTFCAAAKALKEKGVEYVTLIVSHCESNIFKGDVFDYVDRVETTDSILDVTKEYEGMTKEKLDKMVIHHSYRTL